MSRELHRTVNESLANRKRFLVAKRPSGLVGRSPGAGTIRRPSGAARSDGNLRQDVVDAVVAHANRLVAERGGAPLPLGIAAHKPRHTFALILVAIGKDPTYLMPQLGHTGPAFTLLVYSHTTRRSDDEREWLKALVEGHDWAQNRRISIGSGRAR